MTLVGHSLTGAAIGVLCKPETISTKGKMVFYTVFVCLSVVPDLPLKGWGHDRYDVSHSIFVYLLLVTIAIPLLAISRGIRAGIGGWTTVIGGAAAWLSHILLDSFYNHGKGIAIFWPFSAARLTLPIPWFSTVPSASRFTVEALRVYSIEFVSYLPLVLLVLGLKRTGILQRLFKRMYG